MEEQIKSEISEIDIILKSLYEEKASISIKIRSLEEKKENCRNRLLLHRTQSNQRDWASEKFVFSDSVQSILETKFKLKQFRSQQLAAINATLSNKNVLLLMPTGGGKSLCYQLPALITKGITVVVSPLVALMEDQIYQLKKLDIHAVAVSSNTASEDMKAMFAYLNRGEGKQLSLIYVTPEWLAKSKRFMSGLQKCYAAKRFKRLAVDEVHCISTWGHDFRPDYNYLTLMKNMFPDIPIIGLTATATTDVLLDVQKTLDIPDCVVLKAPFDRPNLNFEVIQKPDKPDACIERLVTLITNKFKNKCGIVYTATIKDCEEVAKELRKHNLRVRPYHAEMDKEIRRKVHEKWITNEIQIIVGTIAFGMGIDKPDVRFVIHFTIPKTMESLYQEAGRAGRDGDKASCIIMYRLADYLKQSAYANSKEQMIKVRFVLDYCLNLKECRHLLIGKHFEEVTSKSKYCNKMCDNCNLKNPMNEYNISNQAKVVMNIIKQETVKENNLTLKKCMDIWMKKENKNPFTVEQAERLIANLISMEYIREERNYTAYSVNIYLKALSKVINDNLNIQMHKRANLEKFLSASKKRKLDVDCE